MIMIFHSTYIVMITACNPCRFLRLKATDISGCFWCSFLLRGIEEPVELNQHEVPSDSDVIEKISSIIEQALSCKTGTVCKTNIWK